MREFPVELLVYALIFAGILIFNYLVQRLARRAQQQAPPSELPMPEEAEVEPPLDTGWGRTREISGVPEEVLAARRTAPRRAVSERPELRPRPRALFASREDVRRGVIAMTVLGPCRADEPHDRR